MKLDAGNFSVMTPSGLPPCSNRYVRDKSGVSGGSLGGEKECSDSTLALNMSCVGTCPGGLAGYMRTVQMPIGFETHTAPRIPGQPVQSFETRMMRLQGQLPPGDPDFDLLRITAEENVGRAWNDVWVAAIDRETRLLWEARLTHHRETETWMQPGAGGTTEITYRYSDYREVEGLQMPHRLEYYTEGRKSGENVIRRIEIDSGLTSALFDPSAHRR